MTFAACCTAMCFQPLNYLNLLKSQISSNWLKICTSPHKPWLIPIWKLYGRQPFNAIFLTNKICFTVTSSAQYNWCHIKAMWRNTFQSHKVSLAVKHTGVRFRQISRVSSGLANMYRNLKNIFILFNSFFAAFTSSSCCTASGLLASRPQKLNSCFKMLFLLYIYKKN